MEIEKSKVLIQFFLIFRQSGDLLFFLHTRRFRGYTATVFKNFSKDFSHTESRIMGALSKLVEFFLNPQVRICSVAVPGTSRNNKPENRELTGDRFLGDLCPEVGLSACYTSDLNDSEQEKTQPKFLNMFYKAS